MSQDQSSPTAPTVSVPDAANYAQGGVSVVVNGQQFNLALSDFGGFPYGKWMYLEVNAQDAVGQAPGVSQIPVELSNVTLTFSGLPAELAQIAIGVKASHNADNQGVNILGKYDVVNGGVSIPVETQYLTAYFGPTQYSLWFMGIHESQINAKAMHAKATANAKGSGQQVEVSGTLPDGQTVTLGQGIDGFGAWTGTSIGMETWSAADTAGYVTVYTRTVAETWSYISTATETGTP